MFSRETYRSKLWLEAVRRLPFCVACGRGGQNQAAHRNEGKGMGIKADDCATAALCPDCHHEIDNGKNLLREERRALMDSYIVRTVIELAQRGKLTVIK